MTTTQQPTTTRRYFDDLNRRVSENVTTLLFRMDWQQKDLAANITMTATTLGRKIKGHNDWRLNEVAELARTLRVTLEELTGELPTYEDWVARPKGFEPLTF